MNIREQLLNHPKHMKTHGRYPAEGQQFVVDDRTVHAVLCLSADDRADGAELYASALAGPNSTETTRAMAEAAILDAIAPVTGRLGHLRDSDRLFVLHAMSVASRINENNPDKTRIGWGK